MKNIIFITVITIITIICAPAFAGVKARAGELSLSVSPPILQIEAIPPASIETPITIQNLSDTSVELQILFKPFTQADSEDGIPRYLNKNEPFPGANPLIFQRMQIRDAGHNIKNLLLAPHQEKKLTLHIGILKDEPLSDYYFSILFVSKNLLENDGNLTQTSGGIATNVLLSVGPRGQAKGFVEEFSTLFLQEKGPVPFTVRMKNTSSQYMNPKGEIIIKNMFGQLVGKVDLLPVPILSHTIRAIPDSLQAPDATPSATLNSQLSTLNSPKAFWNESFILGPYSATLTVALSEQGPQYTKTIHFIGFPGQAVIALIASIILVLIIKDRLERKLE